MNKLSIVAISMGALSVGLYAGVGLYATRVAEARVNQVIKDIDDVEISYGNLKVNPLGFDVVIQDVSVKSIDPPTDVFIEKIIVRDVDDKSDIPTYLDASMQGITVKTDDMAQLPSATFFQQAGYTEPLSLNLDTKYRYQEATREMSLDKFHMSAEEVGELEMTFKLGNVNLESASTEQPILHRAEVVYRDNSFADRLLASMAVQSNQNPQQFKTQLSGTLTQAAQFFIPPDNQAATAALEEAIAFIQNPKGFSISANPQTPLKIDELSGNTNPLDWVDKLNLEIESH